MSTTTQPPNDALAAWIGDKLVGETAARAEIGFHVILSAPAGKNGASAEVELTVDGRPDASTAIRVRFAEGDEDAQVPVGSLGLGGCPDGAHVMAPLLSVSAPYAVDRSRDRTSIAVGSLPTE